MKHIWLVLSMLALANVLALAGVLGWLKATDRLNGERVEKVRAIFAKPVGVEAAELQAIAVAQTASEEEAQRSEKLAQPPKPAAERIAEDRAAAELEMQQMLRRQREIDDLGSQLLRRQAELDRREEELEARVLAFEEQKKKYLEIEGAAQFKAALATLEGLKSREAKAMLEAMLGRNLEDEVTAYLTRMDERKRAGIIAEFAKEQPSLAAELLERLRTRGVTDAEGAASASVPATGEATADASTGGNSP